jgi:hypothetical protein
VSHLSLKRYCAKGASKKSAVNNSQRKNWACQLQAQTHFPAPTSKNQMEKRKNKNSYFNYHSAETGYEAMPY